MAQIDLRNAELSIWDSGTNYIIVKIGEGNLTYDERRNMEPVKRRGKLATFREGDEENMEVNFSFVWEYITSGSSSDPPTVEDALTNGGTASSWSSTATDSQAPYCVNLQIDYQPPCAGNYAWETIVFPEFNYQELHHSLKDGTVDCRGLCNRTRATATRVTPTP